MFLRRNFCFSFFVIVSMFVTFSSTSLSAQPSACAALSGGIVVANDGTFLGKLTSSFDTNSIFNKFGTYGNKFSAKSIWNQFGSYGSQFSTNSAMNTFTSTPPKIFVSGQIVAYLSKNQNINGAIDPLLLGITCFGYEPD